MKLFKLFIILYMAIIIPISGSAVADEIDDYRISADDQISVTVFNENDLSVDKVRVSGNGDISMPLLGQVPLKATPLRGRAKK